MGNLKYVGSKLVGAYPGRMNMFIATKEFMLQPIGTRFLHFNIEARFYVIMFILPGANVGIVNLGYHGTVYKLEYLHG